jgi:hypothetical protein
MTLFDIGEGDNDHFHSPLRRGHFRRPSSAPKLQSVIRGDKHHCGVKGSQKNICAANSPTIRREHFAADESTNTEVGSLRGPADTRQNISAGPRLSRGRGSRGKQIAELFVASVGAMSWLDQLRCANQIQFSIRRQLQNGAVECTGVQFIAPLFTPQPRAACGRKKLRSIGPNTPASNHGWRNTGFPENPYRTRESSPCVERSIEFRASFATKDGAEPSIARPSDAGAVPAASTMMTSANSNIAIRATRRATASLVGVILMGAKKDRRRSDDRNCTRHDTAVIGSTQNCEQRQRSRRSAPRGVSEAEPAGRLATEARYCFQFGGAGAKALIRCGEAGPSVMPAYRAAEAFHIKGVAA